MPPSRSGSRSRDTASAEQRRCNSPTKRPRIAQASSSQIARATQRAPKSCRECTRRKIKCDKQQPCEACSTRGEAYLCRREAVIYKGSLVIGDSSQKDHSIRDLVGEVADLRKRVQALERISSQDFSIDKTRHDYVSRPGTGAPSPPRQDIGFEQYKLPGTMEEFALGIGETTRWKGASLLQTENAGGSSLKSSPWYQSVPHLTTISSLPSRPICTSLLGYYLEELAWMTCAVNGGSIITEHNIFWNDYEQATIKDDPWLACLFAVLSLSAFFMDETQATARGLSVEQLRLVASTWFDCSIATLYRCALMTTPSLLTCQTIQILGPAFHLTGNTTLHQSMTAIEHAQMRMINLNLLGDRSPDGQDESLNKEVGRRVWWNSVESHWGFLPYYRYTQFFPHQFSTGFPQMSDERYPGSDGSIAIQYRIACFKSSRIIFTLYGNLDLTENPAYERVLTATKDLDALRSSLHADLQFRADEASSLGLNPSSNRRRLLALSLAYRSYQLHRLFFVKSLAENTRYETSFHTCIDAANTIFDVIEAGLPAVYYKLWNVTVAIIIAGIVSSLHLLQLARTRAVPAPRHRPRIQQVVDRLRDLDDPSGIARRGSIFIDHLFRAEADIIVGLRSDVRFTRESILKLVQSVDEVPDIRQSGQLSSSGISAIDFGGAPLAATGGDEAFLQDPVVPWYPHSADFDLTSLLNDFMANGQL